MLFQASKVVGLDIGTTSIKVAQLDVSKKGAVLTNFGFIPTPSGSISGGEITSPQTIAESVQGLFESSKIKRKNVCVGIWGAAVIVKKISVPKMEEDVLAEQIRWEAEQYIPFDINSINLDYHVLKGRGGGDTMEILLVAAQKDFVFKYSETIELSGLKCPLVDVAGFALANAFQLNYGELPGEVVALLNIGASVTNFVVIENGNVMFSRDVLFGGANYTADIQKQMNITPEEAETMKLSAATGQAVPQEVFDVIKQTNEAAVDELGRCFEFFQQTISESAVQRIFVSGGSIGVPGLVDAVSKSKGIPFEVLNPFNKMGSKGGHLTQEYLGQISAFAPVAVGLGLRKVGDR